MSGKKGKSGRKRIPITERDKHQIEVMAGLGVPLDNIAVILGISPRTLDSWLKLPDIFARYKKAKVQAELTIAKALFEKAMSGCVPAIIWWERTRCGRSDRTEVKHFRGNIIIVKATQSSAN